MQLGQHSQSLKEIMKPLYCLLTQGLAFINADLTNADDLLSLLNEFGDGNDDKVYISLYVNNLYPSWL